MAEIDWNRLPAEALRSLAASTAVKGEALLEACAAALAAYLEAGEPWGGAGA